MQALRRLRRWPRQAPQPVGPKILVATRALPIGTIIGPDSFRYQPWPKELVENAYFVEGQNVDVNKLNGTVVAMRSPPASRSHKARSSNRVTAASSPQRLALHACRDRFGLCPERRRRLCLPGGRVDMVLTQTVDGNDGPALRTSETIIRNVRVLATDQRTVSEDKDGNTEVKVSSNVTLEVTPRIAGKRLPLPSQSFSSRCPCAPLRTMRRNWNARLPLATCGFPKEPTRRLKSRCCSPSHRVRSIPTRPL